MPKELSLHAIDAKDGKIIVKLKSAAGRDFALSLTPFDVSTLISGLYAARGEAFGQKPDKMPEVLLRIQGVTFGDDINHVLMRLHVNDSFHHDYAAEKGLPLARVLERISEELARELGDEPEEFDGPKQMQ